MLQTNHRMAAPKLQGLGSGIVCALFACPIEHGTEFPWTLKDMFYRYAILIAT